MSRRTDLPALQRLGALAYGPSTAGVKHESSPCNAHLSQPFAQLRQEAEADAILGPRRRNGDPLLPRCDCAGSTGCYGGCRRSWAAADIRPQSRGDPRGCSARLCAARSRLLYFDGVGFRLKSLRPMRNISSGRLYIRLPGGASPCTWRVSGREPITTRGCSMYRTTKSGRPHQVMLHGLKARLRALDLRIARMRALHPGSVDPLARRLITHSLIERDDIVAKLSRAEAKSRFAALLPEQA